MIGKVVLGIIVAKLVYIGTQFGKILLICCAFLRLRSIQRMLNKLYVIGVRQCEVVERCFLHEDGVYIFPMNDKDLDALNGEPRKLKIITNNLEIFGAHVRMPHVETVNYSEEKKREAQEMQLEYRYIQDVHYFLPGFVISQLLGSIIQFWTLWIGLLVVYVLAIFWVTYIILIKPGGGYRSLQTTDDLLEGLKELGRKVLSLFLSLAIPFILKGIVLKQFGKYWSDRKSGITAPKRFIFINFVQMVSVSIFLWLCDTKTQ